MAEDDGPTARPDRTIWRTSPADQPLSPRAVQNVARLRNLNVRIDPTPVEPELMYLLAGHAPREWFACTYNDLLICVNKVGEHLAKWGVR